MRVRERRLENRLAALDNTYTAGSVCEAGFYEVLQQHGIEPNNSVLLDIIPDSGTTVVGRLLDKNGQQWNFDIDYASKQYSEITPAKSKTNDKPNLESRMELEFALRLLATKTI